MNREGSAIVRLFRETRRRKVFRTAALYVLGARLALQVADVLFPGFGVSNAAIQALVWAAVLGFPVALVFGWLFDIGPDGIRRTVPSRSDATAPQPLTRTDYLLLAAFVAVGLALLYRAAEGVRRAPADQPAVAGVPLREAAARLTRAKTERLKALRLAKEAADKLPAAPAADPQDADPQDTAKV